MLKEKLSQKNRRSNETGRFLLNEMISIQFHFTNFHLTTRIKQCNTYLHVNISFESIKM